MKSDHTQITECPKCGMALKHKGDILVCPSCGAKFKIKKKEK